MQDDLLQVILRSVWVTCIIPPKSREFVVVQTPDIAYHKPASGFVLEEEKADAVSESVAVKTDVGCEKPAGGRSAANDVDLFVPKEKEKAESQSESAVACEKPADGFAPEEREKEKAGSESVMVQPDVIHLATIRKTTSRFTEHCPFSCDAIFQVACEEPAGGFEREKVGLVVKSDVGQSSTLKSSYSRITLPQTNTSHLKRFHPKRKRSFSKHPFCRCENVMLVSGRVSI